MVGYFEPSHQSALVAGTKRIAQARDEKAAMYSNAFRTADALLTASGSSGIVEKELITKVEMQAKVAREIAVYAVSELRSKGLAKRDKETRITYPI